MPSSLLQSLLVASALHVSRTRLTGLAVATFRLSVPHPPYRERQPCQKGAGNDPHECDAQGRSLSHNDHARDQNNSSTKADYEHGLAGAQTLSLPVESFLHLVALVEQRRCFAGTEYRIGEGCNFR